MQTPWPDIESHLLQRLGRAGLAEARCDLCGEGQEGLAAGSRQRTEAGGYGKKQSAGMLFGGPRLGNEAYTQPCHASCVACCVSPLHPWTPRLVAAPDHVFALPTSFKVISHPSGTLPRPVPAPSLKWLLQLQSSSSWKTRVQRADAARNTCLQHFLGASVVPFVINRASAIVQASPIEALNSEGIASCRALFLSLLARHSAVVAR